jgi:hypothetical protein
MDKDEALRVRKGDACSTAIRFATTCTLVALAHKRDACIILNMIDYLGK